MRRTRGWSAAPSATSCSCGPCSTWTSPARAPGRREPLRPPVRRPPSPALGTSRSLAGGHRRHRETVDFTPLGDGIDADLATRDFTFNAIAVHVGTGASHDPLDGRADLEAGIIRAVSESIFLDDPLRLLRAVRFEGELGFPIDPSTEALLRASAALVTEPAGERVLGELERLSPSGYRRLDDVGLLARSADGSTSASTRSTIPTSGSSPSSGTTSAAADLERAEALRGGAAAGAPARGSVPPRDPSLSSEDGAVGARRARVRRRPELTGVVEAARRADPPAPLVRGDELGLEPGPAIGRILDAIDEERAAGTISTRDERSRSRASLRGGAT